MSPASWQYPVNEMVLTDVWSRQLADEDHSKPTACGTKFRYSAALNCSRKLVFDALGVPESDPIDPAGVHVTTIGTWLHTQMQDAVAKKYPGSQFEIKSQVGVTSGSSDGVIGESVIVHWDGGDISWEIKSVSNYPFHKAIGLQGMGYKAKRVSPAGPDIKHVVQAGLNALGNGCDTVVISYIAKEAISKPVAERIGFSMYERFCAEWHVGKEVWLPLVEAEVARLDMLNGFADLGYIPQGDAYDDDGWVEITPTSTRPHYTCGYCSHRTTCIAYEAGIDIRPVEVASA